jgi:hypothetical protein
MKKLLIAASMLISVSATFAQEGSPQNVIKVNPLGIFFGNASLAYERALGEKSSFVIAPSFGFLKLSGFKYSSFGIGAEYRKYLSKTRNAPAGLYVAPGVGYTGGSVKVDDGNSDKVTYNSFTLKAVLGHQWIWDSGFVLDLNGGIQYFSFSYDNKNGAFSGLAASGVFPALGLSIGYAF